MVAKTMHEQESCQGCDQEHNCQKVYEKLGSIGGSSVALKAVVAFLLPIVVFIVSLVIFEKILPRLDIGAGLQTVFGVAASLLVTSVLVLIVDRIYRIKTV